jgi:hypothetical protein
MRLRAGALAVCFSIVWRQLSQPELHSSDGFESDAYRCIANREVAPAATTVNHGFANATATAFDAALS